VKVIAYNHTTFGSKSTLLELECSFVMSHPVLDGREDLVFRGAVSKAVGCRWRLGTVQYNNFQCAPKEKSMPWARGHALKSGLFKSV
jgi:hypothetical protein